MLGERESDFVVFQGMQNRLFGKAQKICLRYFKIGQTYFEICALYFFYGTQALPISICIPVIRSNSRLYLAIRFSSNTFSSIPTFSGL